MVVDNIEDQLLSNELLFDCCVFTPSKVVFPIIRGHTPMKHEVVTLIFYYEGNFSASKTIEEELNV